MSTDYSVWCAQCRLAIHLGQRFLPNWAFGYGTGDIEHQRKAGDFIVDHDHDGTTLRISTCDDLPDDVIEPGFTE